MKRVLYVIDHLGGGGAEQVAVNVMNKTNADKMLYLTEGRGIREQDITAKIEIKGGLKNRRAPISSAIELRGLINSFRPDIVHVFLMYSCFISSLAVRTAPHGPIFICQEFSPPDDVLSETRFKPIKKALLKSAFKASDMIVTTTKYVGKRMIADGYVDNPGRTTHVYDGLDMARIDNLESKESLRKKLGLPDDLKYVSFMAAMVRRKGPHVMIDAFKRIKREDARLLMIGDGPMIGDLKSTASGDKRIEFLGYRRDGIEYVKASDVFVLPSFYEGLANVLIEAMACGTPVIATSVSGTPELIKDNVNGMLVKPNDPAAVADAAIRVLDDPATANRLINEGLKTSAYYNIDRMASDYEALYESLMKTRKCGA